MILMRILRSMPVPQSASGDPQTTIAVRDLLARMDQPDRELLALRYVVGLTGGEIGEHLGVTPEAIRSRLHRLRRRVIKEMSDVD